MPKIIPEILREIFISLFGNDDDIVQHIETFMLSGKEPFEEAIKFFSTAIRVTVNKFDFVVLFPSGPYLLMSYDCVFLKPILKAISTSLKELEFHKKPIGVGEDIVYDMLITEGVKTIEFYEDHDVPVKYMEQIRNLSSPVRVTFKKHTSFTNLSVVRPPPSSKLSIYMNFTDLMAELSDNYTYPLVEDLELVGGFDCAPSTSKLIEDFVGKIFKIFPNLKTIKAAFGYYSGEHYRMEKHFLRRSLWENILDTMEKVSLEMLKDFPKNVKGFIRFQAIGADGNMKNITDKIKDGEGINIGPNYVEKEFNIHEDMEFKLYAYLPEADSSDDDSDVSINDYEESDSDDYEMESDNGDEELMDH